MENEKKYYVITDNCYNILLAQQIQWNLDTTNLYKTKSSV